MTKAEAIEAFMALGQEARLDIVRLLIARGSAGMLAGEIATALSVRNSSLSSNLSILRLSGLVVRTREGRGIRYRVNFDNLQSLLRYLLEECCGAKPELCRNALDDIWLGLETGTQTHERAHSVHRKLGPVDPR